MKRTKCPKCGTTIICKNKQKISYALKEHKRICNEMNKGKK